MTTLPPPPPPPPGLVPLPPTAAPGAPPRPLAWLLLVPAAIALLISYVIPTVQVMVGTIRTPSLAGRKGDWIGGRAWSRELGDTLVAVLRGLALVAPALGAVLVGTLLGLAAAHAGRPARWTLRIMLAALAATLVSPAALLVSILVDLRDGPSTGTRWLLGAPLLVPAAAAVAATAALAAARRGTRPARPGTALAVVTAGLICAATAIALALQDPSGITRAIGRGPAERIWRGLLFFDIASSDVAATVLLTVLGALGLGTVALVIATGLRLDVAPRRARAGATTRSPAAVPAAVVTVLGIVVLLAVAWFCLRPWLHLLTGTTTFPTVRGTGDSTWATTARTWLPPLLPAVVGVLVALAGGVAIGGLRPAGRYSEALLLPFAPWLFVGSLPFVVHRIMDLGRTGEWLQLIPPVWINVPALVVFTLFFRGQCARVARRTGRSHARCLTTWPVILPALPLVAAVGVVAWIVLAQDLVWSMATSSPQRPTGPASMLNAAGQYGLGIDLGTGRLVALVVACVLAGAALQVTYLDRITLRAGRAPVGPARDGHPAAGVSPGTS